MKRTLAELFRLSMAKKFLIGFLSCAILTILIDLIAFSCLQRVNEIHEMIIERDVPLMEITDKMIEALLAQELYGRRSIMLKRPEVEALFWKRSKEFKMLLQDIGKLPDNSSLPLVSLSALHEAYNRVFKTGFENQKSFSPEAFKDHDQLIRKKQEEIVQLVKGISRGAREDQNKRTNKILDFGNSAFWITAGLTFDGLLLGILIALIISRSISGSVHQMKLFARKISEGSFDDLPEVPSHDELGDLSQTFHKMAQRLKNLEELHLDANPLTHLPGNIAIEKVVNQRLKEKTPLAFCQLDLSHFKAFNDRYGYARGNEILQALSRIITEATQEYGNADSYVGHIGGDDFVLITSPETYENLCLAIIDSFDKMVLDFYDPKDRKAGYIKGETRQGQKASFPIMSLAIAVVTNLECKLENHVQIGEIAAEMKRYAKSFSRSTFAVDRRRVYVSPSAET